MKDLSADKQNIEEYNNKIRSYENRIMDSEKQIKELKEENETLKRSLEQNHDIPNILSDSSYSKELRLVNFLYYDVIVYSYQNSRMFYIASKLLQNGFRLNLDGCRMF